MSDYGTIGEDTSSGGSIIGAVLIGAANHVGAIGVGCVHDEMILGLRVVVEKRFGMTRIVKGIGISKLFSGNIF